MLLIHTLTVCLFNVIGITTTMLISFVRLMGGNAVLLQKVCGWMMRNINSLWAISITMNRNLICSWYHRHLLLYWCSHFCLPLVAVSYFQPITLVCTS